MLAWEHSKGDLEKIWGWRLMECWFSERCLETVACGEKVRDDSSWVWEKYEFRVWLVVES